MDDRVISVVGFLTLYPSDLLLQQEESGATAATMTFLFKYDRLNRFLSLQNIN